MVTIDEYPALSLMQARAERDKLRMLLKDGANPAHVARIERAVQAERVNTTFGTIALELLAKRAKEGLGPGSVKRERRLIEKDLAFIADLPITDVSAPILLAALRKLEQRGRGGDCSPREVSCRTSFPVRDGDGQSSAKSCWVHWSSGKPSTSQA
ncbi:hypothetical protein FHY29_000094 [Xanthomonas arboricola]